MEDNTHLYISILEAKVADLEAKLAPKPKDSGTTDWKQEVERKIEQGLIPERKK